MLTILTTLLGIFSSVIPSVLQYFTRKQEIKYEMEMAKIKIDAAIQGIKVEAALGDARALVDEGADLREHDIAVGGYGGMESLRASVRPVITYIFFFIFVGIKVLAAVAIVMQGGLNINNVQEFVNIILDDSTVAILGTVLGFWFGSRSLSKLEEVISTKYKVTDTTIKKRGK